MQENTRTVTVYAASSDTLDAGYISAARETGIALAQAGYRVLYGGGGTGLMGAMADGALSAGAEVHGVVPVFLKELEVSHKSLTSLTVVDDMRNRKHMMLEGSDAVVTLPGGCGTYEEVFEAMTLKKLGQWSGPIVLLNTLGFYGRLSAFLHHSVTERFMRPEDANLWQVVDLPAAVPAALEGAGDWHQDSLSAVNVSC